MDVVFLHGTLVIFRLVSRYLGSVLCKLCHFCAMGSSAASVFSIVAISIVKHRLVLLLCSHPASVLTLAFMFGRNTLISIVPVSVSLNTGIKNQMGSGPIQSVNTRQERNFTRSKIDIRPIRIV